MVVVGVVAPLDLGSKEKGTATRDEACTPSTNWFSYLLCSTGLIPRLMLSSSGHGMQFLPSSTFSLRPRALRRQSLPITCEASERHTVCLRSVRQVGGRSVRQAGGGEASYHVIGRELISRSAKAW